VHVQSKCKSTTTTTAAGLSERCDAFDFLAGLIVYGGPANQGALIQYPEEFQPFIPMMEFFYLPP
jgi:hypothetical protein